MAAIELTLSPEYQRSEWGVREALREIISNAIDGETRGRSSGTGKMSFEYNKRSKILSVKNEQTIVPTKALLMGASDSRGNTDCIGKFGEGLPMSLLVLARKGMEVVIFNGKEKWTPVLAHSDRFETEVLTVQTREMIKERNDFVVEIHDIEPDEFEEMRNMFLRFDSRFDETMTVKAGTWSGTQVLLQEEFRGCLYNQGVFVQKKADLCFGYDLNVKLNRDRSYLDEYDIRDQVNDVLVSALNANAVRFVEEILPVLFDSEGSFEAGTEWGAMTYSSTFRDAMTNEWNKRFGPEVIAVRTESERDQALRLGVKAVVVSKLLATVMKNVNGGLEAAQQEADNRIVETIAVDDLTTVERQAYEAAFTLASSVVPVLRSRELVIVQFGSSKDRLSHGNTGYMARSNFADLRSAFKAMAKEAAEAEGSVAMDAQLDVLARMLARLH